MFSKNSVIETAAGFRCLAKMMGDFRMEWVLLVSLQWIVSGSPTAPTTEQIQSFASEELCNKAAEAVRNEINAPLAANPRTQTLGRVVCVKRKDN